MSEHNTRSSKTFVFEARYIGTAGKNLLVATALNQGFDLNDPNTPDHIFERFNQAYVAAGSPNGALNSGRQHVHAEQDGPSDF